MNTYRTAEIARMIGIHPNTVRLYETLGLVSKPERRANGYRVFTELHLAQFRLARTALQVEVLQNGLRKNAIEIIKVSAAGRLDEALALTDRYLEKLKKERENAEEAIEIARRILSGEGEAKQPYLTRKETADDLHVTIDTLRNWEMNGLLSVRRKQNGYRVYSGEDLRRLKLIRTLRCANYSLAAILRMLSALSLNPGANLKRVIDTPGAEEEIISVCDRLITSLKTAQLNGNSMRRQLEKLKAHFS